MQFSPNAVYRVSLWVLVLTLTGCAYESIHIKAVDGATKEPLAGVIAEWRQDRDQMFKKMIHEGPTNLPPSSQDGIIDIGRVHRNWASTFIFSHAGYSNVYGSYAGGKLTLATNVGYYPPGMLEGRFRLDSEVKTAVKSDGFFLVPMQR